MFHMMNAARIEIGLAASSLGMAGYATALDYAKDRRQGRPRAATGKDTSQPQVPIVEHADVKRMLLAQKAYAEGGTALALYAARLLDDQSTGSPAEAERASALLEILTPIVKSWPSEWCLEANSLAIQVLGGAGYTRDWPVEMYWRDQRLNMIHEGTHGIQALDLLGRKVRMDDGCTSRRAAGSRSEARSTQRSGSACALKRTRLPRAPRGWGAAVIVGVLKEATRGRDAGRGDADDRRRAAEARLRRGGRAGCWRVGQLHRRSVRGRGCQARRPAGRGGGRRGEPADARPAGPARAGCHADRDAQPAARARRSSLTWRNAR